MSRALKNLAEIQTFLDQVVAWAQERTDIRAIALVGSYAREKATESSDIDLVLLVDEPGFYLAEMDWTSRFGKVLRHQVEEYGRVTSLRAWYQDGPEVEFGLTTPDWASLPLDEGTSRVLTDGAIVLFERERLISPLLEGLSKSRN